jgi:hypothetical protein
MEVFRPRVVSHHTHVPETADLASRLANNYLLISRCDCRVAGNRRERARMRTDVSRARELISR